MKQIIIIILIITIIILICLVLKQKESFITYKDIKYSDNLTIENIKKLKHGQRIMTKMFKEFNSICRKHNIKYWCLGGTLIGAIRHKGWIPWDGDIDIGMLNEDYKKFKKVNNELPNDIEFSEPKNKPCSKLRSKNAKYIYTKWGNNWDTDKGLQIDIFIFKKKGKHIGDGNCVCGYPDKKIREYNDIFPLKEIKFEDINVYIPNKYENISKEIWGGYPPKMIDINKRYPHEGNIEIIETFDSNTNKYE